MRERRLGEAENPETTPARLARLSRLTDWRVRREVALNPNTSSLLLLRLASVCEDPRVKNAAFKNPHCPYCLD